MLFANSIEPKDIVTWVLVAMLVVAIGALASKYVAMYRKIKKTQKQLKKEREELANAVPDKLLAIDGDYFVLSCEVEYAVGADGQLRQGRYELKSADGCAFTVRICADAREYNDGDTVQLTDGDTICATTNGVLIKPIEASGEEDGTLV